MKLMEKTDISIRSSAAEYLTYIVATGGEDEIIEIRYEDENIWLTQKMLSILYDVTISAINGHIITIYKDFELTKEATIRKFPMIQNEGRRKIKRTINHYNLQMIISIDFKVNNEKAVQFRKWANSILKEYTIKGFALDDDRLKNNGSILTEKYFEELLERIREIRLLI